MSYRRNQVRCSDRMCGATDCPACYPDSAFGVEICAKCYVIYVRITGFVANVESGF